MKDTPLQIWLISVVSSGIVYGDFHPRQSGELEYYEH